MKILNVSEVEGVGTQVVIQLRPNEVCGYEKRQSGTSISPGLRAMAKRLVQQIPFLRSMELDSIDLDPVTYTAQFSFKERTTTIAMQKFKKIKD